MGLRLSLFRGSPAKTDDKELSQEVTPSEPTPTSDSTVEAQTQDTERPKCQCSDCKCDPCNCSHCPTTTTESPKPPDQQGDSQVAAEVTPQSESKVTENAQVHEKPSEVSEETAKEAISVEAPRDDVIPEEVGNESKAEQSHEAVAEALPETVQLTPDEVKDEASAEPTSEKKCLCSPCQCNPCKCGCHEATEPKEQSPNEESAAPQPPTGATPEQVEPIAKEVDPQSADVPETPEFLSEAALATNEP